MARVRVKKEHRGFDGTQMRESEEEFNFAGAPGDWFEYLDPKEQAEAEAKHRQLLIEKKRNEIEVEVRAQLEAKIRAESETKLRAEIEAELRAEGKSKAKTKDEAKAQELV